MSTNITVILPVHEIQENIENYLKKSIESVSNQLVKPDELLIVRSNNKELKELLNKVDFGEIKKIVRIIENPTKDYGFPSQINYGVSECKTEYDIVAPWNEEFKLELGKQYRRRNDKAVMPRKTLS